ncbi:MAG: hypothetical protein EVA67_07010 [OM182 bacterium]|nr:MAG: hypothetical protein EVA67_07010 [OM182 bacterium]
MADDGKVGFRAMNPAEYEIIETVAAGADKPFVMLNLNAYAERAGYPNGQGYQEYMAKLDQLLSEAGGKVLWRVPVEGSLLGGIALHEVIAIYYPSHQAFLNMRTLPSSDENFRLRELAVDRAQLHRCTELPGEWLSR